MPWRAESGTDFSERSEASAINAKTHGMTAMMIAHRNHDEMIRLRLEQWQSELRPVGPYQSWLAKQAVAASFLIDRCQTDKITWRERQKYRAEGAWDVDRRAEVERLAEGLSKRPAWVSAQLRQSLHGCDWLLAHWRGLRRFIRGGGGGVASPPPGDDTRRLARRPLCPTPQ